MLRALGASGPEGNEAERSEALPTGPGCGLVYACLVLRAEQASSDAPACNPPPRVSFLGHRPWTLWTLGV